MAVKALFVFQGSDPYLYDITLHEREPLPEAVHPLIEFGILSSRKDPFDPMEKALQRLGQDYLAKTEHLHTDWQLLQEYPLSTELLAMSCVWQSPNGLRMVAAKGAPEAIAELCHFTNAQQNELAQHVQAMAKEGLRVLGVAKGRQAGTLPKTHANLAADTLPIQQHDFEFEFVGFIGLVLDVKHRVRIGTHG